LGWGVPSDMLKMFQDAAAFESADFSTFNLDVNDHHAHFSAHIGALRKYQGRIYLGHVYGQCDGDMVQPYVRHVKPGDCHGTTRDMKKRGYTDDEIATIDKGLKSYAYKEAAKRTGADEWKSAGVIAPVLSEASRHSVLPVPSNGPRVPPVPCGGASSTCCGALTELSQSSALGYAWGAFVAANVMAAAAGQAKDCAQADRCVQAFDEAMTIGQQPIDDCSCSSSFVKVDDLRTACLASTSSAGSLCALNRNVTFMGKAELVTLSTFGCLPEQCNNPADLSQLNKAQNDGENCTQASADCENQWACY